MHMADALLSPAVGGALYVLSGAGMAYAARTVKRIDSEGEKLPLMAVSGAFVFAAQMINFSIPGTGSSGHIGGGILLAGLLGGAPALLALAVVLIVQCLFFADGGLLALGANIFNMGVIPCLLVYPLVFRPMIRRGVTKRRLAAASFCACVVSLQLGAFGVVLETLASGVTELPFGTFVALMQPIHLAIGAVEGIATAAVLGFVHTMRPELFEDAHDAVPARKVVAVLAAAALVVAGLFSLCASGDPDGLEWSMERTAGTSELERAGTVHRFAAAVQERLAFLPDYSFSDGEGGTSVAGIAGVLLTCGALGVWKLLHRRA